MADQTIREHCLQQIGSTLRDALPEVRYYRNRDTRVNLTAAEPEAIVQIDGDITPGEKNTGMDMRFMRVDVVCFVAADRNELLGPRLSDLTSLVEQAIASNFTLGGYAIDCELMGYDGVDISTVEGELPTSAQVMTFQVQYATAEGKPSVLYA